METIRCRVNRNLWWIPVLAFGEATFLLVTPLTIAHEEPQSSPWLMFLVGAPIAAVMLYAAHNITLRILREEVIADEANLRWRGAFGPWKSARWEEISDFYLGKLKREPVIETPQGKLKLINELTNRSQMQRIIAERALNTPAREWESQKFRAAKPFIQHFDYWTKSQKWTLPILLTVLSLAGLSLLELNFFSSESNVSSLRLQASQPWFWESVALASVLYVPAMWIGVIGLRIAWRDRRFAFRHRDEHLEISPRGLAWQRGESRIEAKWDEVSAIVAVSKRGFAARSSYRVETQNGDFTVWNSLESVGLWLQLVHQFAPQIAPATTPISVDLGGENSTWSGGEVGNGARIFHFRTSENRTILWIPTFVSPCLLLMPYFYRTFQTPDDLPIAPTSVFVWLGIAAALLATLLCWLCFARAAIWADETGLQWRFPLLKTRRVSWNEIEKFGHDERGYFIISNGKRRRLFWAPPVRRDELLQLITTRATMATGHFD